ncbi:hypothetical protein DQ04_01031110, partial [Trypanosoma grayi]|uniref:hypothetical protein n=1 Tax=Trypanosoma grayi TaxID=71804 RepID=UPI0004F3F172
RQQQQRHGRHAPHGTPREWRTCTRRMRPTRYCALLLPLSSSTAARTAALRKRGGGTKKSEYDNVPMRQTEDNNGESPSPRAKSGEYWCESWRSCFRFAQFACSSSPFSLCPR